MVWISVQNPEGGSLRHRLLDPSGRQVTEGQQPWLAPGTHRIPVSVASAVAGVYLLVVTWNDGHMVSFPVFLSP